MSFTTKMTEQYVQQLYQNNTGAKDKARNNKTADNVWQKNQRAAEEEKAAVYEPSNRAERSATYQRPAAVAKKEQDDELKSHLEKVYEGLSTKAKEYLEQLKDKFGNIDFFVANCKTDEEMNRYFAMGKKDYTCVISSELLEKMATDEEVRAKYEGIIDNADESIEEMRAEIKEELGTEAAEQITNIGITIDDKGVVEYFAKLKNSNDSYYAKLKEKRAEAKEEEKKAAEKKAEETEKTETSGTAGVKNDGEPLWIHADSKEGLIDAIREVLGIPAKEVQNVNVAETAK